MNRALVKDLERLTPRLILNRPTRFRVRKPDLIFALVDESIAVNVDKQSVRVGIATHLVGQPQVAYCRRVCIDRRRVGAAPVAGRLRPCIQRLNEHRPHVESSAAYLDQIPSSSEIPQAQFGIRFESATREHNVPTDVVERSVTTYAYAFDSRAGNDEARCRCVVPDLDACRFDGCE